MVLIVVCVFVLFFFFFFFKQETAYEISGCLVGSEVCIRDGMLHSGIPTRICANLGPE